MLVKSIGIVTDHCLTITFVIGDEENLIQSDHLIEMCYWFLGFFNFKRCEMKNWETRCKIKSCCLNIRRMQSTSDINLDMSWAKKHLHMIHFTDHFPDKVVVTVALNTWELWNNASFWCFFYVWRHTWMGRSDRLHISTGGSNAAGKKAYQNNWQVNTHI